MKPIPNRNLPFIATEGHNLLMVELRVKSLSGEIAALKPKIHELKRVYLKVTNTANYGYYTRAKKQLTKLENDFESAKNVLLANNYHPVSLTKI